MGGVICKCLSATSTLHNWMRIRFNLFFYHILKRGRRGNGSETSSRSSYESNESSDINSKEKENGLGREGRKVKHTNYLLRAIKDLTIYERALLSLALVFLGINAYTNLNFPRIMGECIESNNLNYTNCSYLDKLFQKGNVFRFWKIRSSSLQTLVHYFPYFMAGGIASYFRIFFTNKCVKSIECRLKKNVHKKILMEDNEEFRAFRSCDYLVNCTFNEIRYSSKELVTTITHVLRYLNSIIGGMVSMLLISSYLTKFCIFLVPTYGFFVLLILKRINNVKMETNRMDEMQMERFSDILQKGNIVSLFGNQYFENKYFSKKLKNIDKLNQRHLNAEALFYCFLNVGTNLVICSVLCFGKKELSNKHISHGQLISFIAYSSMLGLGIVGMLKLKKEVNVLQMSLRKIYEILDFSHYSLRAQNIKNGDLKNTCKTNTIETNEKLQEKSICDSPKDGKTGKNSNIKNTQIENHQTIELQQYDNEKEVEMKKAITNENKAEAITVIEKKDFTGNNNDNEKLFPENIEGSIKFENVNFSYNCFNHTSTTCVLKNINFEIKAHEKVAIIGKSGSGKTTLWKLLTQEYEYDGNIYVDTYNLKDINKTYFKKKIISISEQECTILNRSLYENLLYGLLPVKIGSRKEVPELIFNHINKNHPFYQKMQALLANNENEREIESLNKSLMEEETMMYIVQNGIFEGTPYEYVKEKCYMYLKNKDKESAPSFSTEELNFMKEQMKELHQRKTITACKENGAIVGVEDAAKTENMKPIKKYVTSEGHIANESILKGCECGQDEINASVQLLCEELDLNSLISALPQEIYSSVQNNSMSSGQKQRVAIIRSLMKNTPIYVFDEITSALDDSNVEKVFHTISSLIPNKTVIYITHSTKMLSYMDKIIIVDNGEIVLEGTYEEIKTDHRFLNVFPSQNAII